MSRSVSRRRVMQSLLASLAVASVPRTAGSALAAPLGQEFEPYWVQNYLDTELWTGRGGRAVTLGRARPFSYFKVLEPQLGPRLYVYDPLTDGTAWIAAVAVGLSGEPPASYLAGRPSDDLASAPAEVPSALGRLDIPARIVGGANIRSWPEVQPNSWVRRLDHNASVWVVDEVTGADGEGWYRVGEREFVHNSLVRLPTPFPSHRGRVLDVDLTEPAIVTGYEDGRAVYAALTLKGKLSSATLTGAFVIQRRVENETMDSSTLGTPRDAPGGYFLKDVLYTQYFHANGSALHYNYWSSNWGYAGSNGCLGLTLADARWLWDWTSVGTPLFIR